MKSSTYPSENEETSLLTATAIKYLPIMGSYQWPPYIVQENTKSSKCINVETERDLSRTSSSKALLIAGSARAGSSGLCPVCPCAPYWRAQSWTQYLDVASMAVLNRGREHLLWLLAVLLLTLPRRLLAFHVTRAHFRLTSIWCPPGPSGHYLQICFSACWYPVSPDTILFNSPS